MIAAVLRAGLVMVVALVLAGPALGDAGNSAAAQSAGGDLRSEYPLHDSKQCCSSAPAPAAAIDRPGGGADGQVDGNGGLTLWLLALALASCLGLAWFVHSKPETIPRVDLSRAAAIAGAVPRAVRRIDLTPVAAAARAVPRAARGIDLSRAGAIAGAVPRAVRRIDLTPVAAAARAVPKAARRIDLKAAVATRDRAGRGGPPIAAPEPPTPEPEPPTPEPEPPPPEPEPPPPEPEPSSIGENRKGMDDEPPTPLRRDPRPKAPRALPSEGSGVAPPPVQLVAPRTFADAEAIKPGFTKSSAIVLDLRSTDPQLATGLTYFASGFTFGLGGAMQELAEGVYLLIPRGVRISAEETARLRASLLP